MEVVYSGVRPQLSTFYVAMEDGSIQEVRAGSFCLTGDNMWTFYREAKVDRQRNTILHVISSPSVRGVYNAEHVVLEVVMERAAKGAVTTETRKRAPKKRPDGAALAKA